MTSASTERALVVALALSLASGCAADAGVEDVADAPDTVATAVDPVAVDQALAWTPPDAYTLELEVTCFCPVNRFRVTVVEGEVTDVVALDDAGAPTEAPAPAAYATSVERIQDELRAVRDGDGVITALEVEDDGRPTLVGLDPLPGAADDEVTYRILDLTPR